MNQSNFHGQWKNHSSVRDIDASGFIVTVQGGRIAGDVNPANVSKSAIIGPNSLIEGRLSCVADGAVIEDSYCKDVVIEEKAQVRDSVLISTRDCRSHKCDAAGLYISKGGNVLVGAASQIERCCLTDTVVAVGSRLKNSTLENCSIGRDNTISLAKISLVHTEPKVRIDGPTEISEAWLGRKTHIHRKGYFEGVFSNDFLILDFDEQTGVLSVREVLDIPHVSEYGTNTINSTNSGRLLTQPDGIMKEFGPQVGLWYDPLLSHEQIRLGPGCWVNPWTKIIGESAQPYSNPAEAVNDRLHTYLMPLCVAGFDGQSVSCLVFPGEGNNGLSHKRRKGAWVFTYCPDAVINMVSRLYDALENDEKYKADIVVKAALQNALCLLKYWAWQLELDLSKPRDKQRSSRSKWFVDYKNLLEAHIQSDIWKFEAGEPVDWIRRDGKWQHEKLDEIRQSFLLPDSRFDIPEDQLLAEPSNEAYLNVELKNALAADDLNATRNTNGTIDPDAHIHPSAVIDRSATIGAGVKVNQQTYIGPGVVLEGNTVIGRNSRLFRTILKDTIIGENTTLYRCVIEAAPKQNCIIGNNVELNSCKISSSEIGDRTIGTDAMVNNSRLACDTTLSMFAAIDNVQALKPTIIGGIMRDCKINTTLMSMHSAGCVTGLVAKPVIVQADDRRIEIPAVSMLGGGCQIHGKGISDDAVVMEGSFIGSNTILETGAFIGFGAFVLGQLGSDEGLLPFTISTQQGPKTDEIGAVLTKFSNIVVTHFINWTYQSLPKEQAGDIVHLINGCISQGAMAIRNELCRREKGWAWDAKTDFARYKSLPLYTVEQLAGGLRIYEKCIEQGCWDVVFNGENLSFTNAEGHWAEKGGHIRWQKKTGRL